MRQKLKTIFLSAATTFWSSTAQKSVCREFSACTKTKLFGRKKRNSFGREVKKAKQAQTAVPILPVLSPGEQNGSLAITAAKTLQDQV